MVLHAGRFWGLLVATVLGVAVLSLISSPEALGGGLLPCGNVAAPLCNGECAPGARCVEGIFGENVTEPCFCAPIGCCQSASGSTVPCTGGLIPSACQNILGSFVAGGTCTESGCISPTPTVTPTSTRTLTPTITPTPGIPNGGDCAESADCASDNCVDGVCCDARCNGELESCNQPGNVGTCTSLAAPAPAASSRGLAFMMVLLLGIGIAAIWRLRAARLVKP